MSTTQNEPLEERLQREAAEKCNIQLYKGREEYFISKDGLNDIISRTIAETLKAAVSAIEREKHLLKEETKCNNEIVDEIMANHYEPAHEEGQTCWCQPSTTVDTLKKRVFIDHKEQRVWLREKLEDLLSGPSDSELMSFGHNNGLTTAITAVEGVGKN